MGEFRERSNVVTSKVVKVSVLETDGLVTLSHLSDHRDLYEESALRYPASVSNLCVIPGSVCSAHFMPSGEELRP